MAGWLWKEGTKNKAFKRRWFALATQAESPKLFDDTVRKGTHAFFLFESDVAAQPRQVVLLRPGTYSCSVPESQRQALPFCMRITLAQKSSSSFHKSRKFILGAENEADIKPFSEHLAAGSVANAHQFSAAMDSRSRAKKLVTKVSHVGVTNAHKLNNKSRDFARSLSRDGSPKRGADDGPGPTSRLTALSVLHDESGLNCSFRSSCPWQ